MIFRLYGVKPNISRLSCTKAYVLMKRIAQLPNFFSISFEILGYSLVRRSQLSQVTVLEGTATWCAQCKAIAPEVAKMVSEYTDVKFYLYDVEECEDVAQELGVSSMPSFSIFKDGDIQDGVTGAKPKEIRKKIEACL